MNGTQTGIAVTGAVGYGILDPTSIVYMAAAIAVLIILYFVGKIFTTRHLRTHAKVDESKGDLVFQRWAAKISEQAKAKKEKE